MSTNWPPQPEIPTPPQPATQPPTTPMPWPPQPAGAAQAGQPGYQPGPAQQAPGVGQPLRRCPPRRPPPPPPPAYPGDQTAYPGVPVPHAGAQPGYPTPGVPTPGGWPPAGASAKPKSNGKLLGLAAGGIAVALLAGGGAMLVGQNLRKTDPAPLLQPVPSAPANPAPTAPARPANPTTPASPAAPTTGTGTPANGTPVTVANGVSVTLPSADWKEYKRGDGSVSFQHASGSIVIYVAVRTGQTSTAVALCDRFVADDAKRLTNASPVACTAGSTVGRVSSALGGLTGTFASQQGSVVLGETVGVGRRDDGLTGAFFMTYPMKQRPSDSALKEAGQIYGSMMSSLNSA